MGAPPAGTANFLFASDNTAGLAPEALAALGAANGGTVPSYGDDEWSARARDAIGRVFETEADVFFVSTGTAANALALAQACPGHQSILCHECAHIETDEAGAPESFTGGSKLVALPGPGCKLRPADLDPVWRGGRGVHAQRPGALSLTQPTEWGTLYAPDEIRALAGWARQHGLAVHLNGSRLANAAAALADRGFAPADWTWRAGIDVLCFGGTKNGLFATEAVDFFRPGLARDFASRLKRAGQLASKHRFAAAQWCGMLEGGAWLRHAAHANAMARRLADALRRLPGARLIVEPEANGVFVELPRPAVEALWARGWKFHPFIGEKGYRLMCSWATAPGDVDRFAGDAAAVLG